MTDEEEARALPPSAVLLRVANAIMNSPGWFDTNEGERWAVAYGRVLIEIAETLAKREELAPAMHRWVSDDGPTPQWHCSKCGAMLTARGGRFQGPINLPCPPFAKPPEKSTT